jgi:hypothetical protein
MPDIPQLFRCAQELWRRISDLDERFLKIFVAVIRQIIPCPAEFPEKGLSGSRSGGDHVWISRLSTSQLEVQMELSWLPEEVSLPKVMGITEMSGSDDRG